MGLFHRKENDNHKAEVIAPQSGKAVLITEVPDPVFSGKVLGDGIAVIPNSGEVVAPASGTIVQIAHTHHAVCIESDDGLDILLHLGIDTVNLEGQGFTCYVEEGQHVNTGDRLMDMDLDFIQSKGLNTISPCIITNIDAAKELKLIPGNADAGKTIVMTYHR